MKKSSAFILSQGNGAGAGELRNELDAARWLILSRRNGVGAGEVRNELDTARRLILSEAKDHQQLWAVVGDD